MFHRASERRMNHTEKNGPTFCR